jgi:hypothetical protein
MTSKLGTGKLLTFFTGYLMHYQLHALFCDAAVAESTNIHKAEKGQEFHTNKSENRLSVILFVI